MNTQVQYEVSDIKHKFFGWSVITPEGNVFQYKSDFGSSIMSHLKPSSINLIEGDYKINIVAPFEKSVNYKEKKVFVPGMGERRIGCVLEIEDALLDEDTDKENLIDQIEYGRRCSIVLAHSKGARTRIEFITLSNPKKPYNINIKQETKTEVDKIEVSIRI